jgi:hypothetical protein
MLRAILSATLTVLFIALLQTGTLKAATVDDVVRLAAAGVSDDVILAYIDRDKTIFSLGPDDVVALRGRGISEAVVIAMLKSGRAEAEAALEREDAERAAQYADALLAAQPIVVIGHGPDRPNTVHPDGFIAPSPVYGKRFGSYGAHGRYVAPAEVVAPVVPPVIGPVAPMMCLAQSYFGPSRGFPSTTITPCPDVMQGGRGKLTR